MMGDGRADTTVEVVYSYVLSSHILDTPCPDAAWWDGNWYETWAGWLEITHYPWSYPNGVGWFYVVPSGETAAWGWNLRDGWAFSIKATYPWIYYTGTGWVNPEE